MPAASQSRWSSSPKPGAMCTIPVPSSVVTKSAARTRKALGGVGEVVEQRAVAAADQLGARDRADLLGRPRARSAYLAATASPSRKRLPVALEDGVVELGADGEGEVGGQRPGVVVHTTAPSTIRGCVARVELEGHRHRRVLAVAVGVVLAGLEVRQRGLALPAVRQDPVALVERAPSPRAACSAHMTLSM